MTFSASVKEELCRVPVSRSCCAVAEAYGVLLYANAFTAREIRIVTASPDFAKRLPRLFRRAFDLEPEIQPDSGKGKRTFTLSDGKAIAAIFDAFGYDADSALVHHVNLGVLESECCRASFARGAFLAGGSVTDPAGRCRLELVTDHRSAAKETYALLLEMGFSPSTAQRGGRSVLYFRRGQAIEDLLTTMGAGLAAMAVMNAAAEKSVRNTVNRRVNCDNANADRIVSAAQAQLERIRAFVQSAGLGSLPEDLREVALLRIANPEASLSELAQLSGVALTKSSVNYRMKKLMNYLEENRE